MLEQLRRFCISKCTVGDSGLFHYSNRKNIPIRRGLFVEKKEIKRQMAAIQTTAGNDSNEKYRVYKLNICEI